MNNRFLLYGHGGSYNHGAEAITKQTISFIRQKYPESQIILSTHFPEQDLEFGVDADILIAPDAELWVVAKQAITEKKLEITRQMYAESLSYIDANTTVLSVGGDNFCYPTWHRLTVFQERVKEVGARSVLWGCSIEPSAISADMINTLNTYDSIIVRESLSENTLRLHGIKTDIVFIPDIAFGLTPEINQVQKYDQTLVGINISPLVERQEMKVGIILESMRNLVKYVLNETNSKIVLIPHVTMSMDNDISALSKLYDTLSDAEKSQVLFINENLSAGQYKQIISQCDAVVAARTHASIAAYSTGVPCLVIGYSIKSKGIAKDLGMSEHVISIKKITNADDIVGGFKALWRDKNNIKCLLNIKMESYKKKLELYSEYC